MSTKRIWILVTITAVLAILLSGKALFRTYKFSQCASGLVLLASLDEKDVVMRPWYWDSYLLSPSMAEWILLNLDYPYECKNDWLSKILNQPLIHMALAGRDQQNDAALDARMLRIFEHLIDRGASVDTYHDGKTLLHVAILFTDGKAVSMLFDAKADPTLTINNPGRKTHGMNAFEFSDWLATESRFPEKHIDFADIVNFYRAQDLPGTKRSLDDIGT